MYVFLYTEHGFMGIAYTQNTIESEGSKFEDIHQKPVFSLRYSIYKSSWI
jgi:hypothetical protein